jgi:ABC-type multidrug transport system fused ATPase/permease subunit
VIDSAEGISSEGGKKSSLSGGVIAGLVVVGSLILLALLTLALGWFAQKKARKIGSADSEKTGGVGVEWNNLSYIIPGTRGRGFFGNSLRRRKVAPGAGFSDDKVVLDGVSGKVSPGQIMAILGPSGNEINPLVTKL